MTRVLSMIDSAYRASLEEQDDAGLWLSAAVKKAGADMTILLSGNAVNYAVKGHPKDAMQIGGSEIAHPMDPNVDIQRLAALGCSCFFVREDAEERGIPTAELIPEVEAISRSQLAEFVEQYDDIWQW